MKPLCYGPQLPWSFPVLRRRSVQQNAPLSWCTVSHRPRREVFSLWSNSPWRRWQYAPMYTFILSPLNRFESEKSSSKMVEKKDICRKVPSKGRVRRGCDGWWILALKLNLFFYHVNSFTMFNTCSIYRKMVCEEQHKNKGKKGSTNLCANTSYNILNKRENEGRGQSVSQLKGESKRGREGVRDIHSVL